VRILVGVDLVEVSRIERMVLVGGRDFLESIWTPEELRYCGGRAKQLASRWAAKEAVMKALGWGIGRIDPADIGIVSEPGERPRLDLTNSAALRAEALGVSSWSISMSHDAGLAIAYATGTGETDA
jgi:holo-[acyl-carrier protein] synthase